MTLRDVQFSKKKFLDSAEWIQQMRSRANGRLERVDDVAKCLRVEVGFRAGNVSSKTVKSTILSMRKFPQHGGTRALLSPSVCHACRTVAFRPPFRNRRMGVYRATLPLIVEHQDPTHLLMLSMIVLSIASNTPGEFRHQKCRPTQRHVVCQ